ncbi:MAG: Asp-tRNA(Asn)/Glu-tRNA(Gln) amidotransferase subunit GatB [Candidatus Omnitrophica bacterium]|nr:Asp-tRNA(Asn)/Glu-tRNA(Gln) amidotransferase subunit GatB [Candidatus Omnitrophota bacterium]MDD5592578.1 Asp-tRNA(Asn)/Glu-tRNA(Gln) amidotransferase subunit GatB [Candidatus Omnitrophota bacterium]
MYETIIGLEVHVHLKTQTKAFCGCSTEFGQEPNSQTCPVCLGFPGSLPVLNKVAFDYAIKVALALNCRVQEYTKFDRKNYFYPDLPKNYQISQYDLPIAKDGFLDIDLEGKTKHIKIRRAHLEEDAGKLIHQQEESLVDFNRSGMPLLEIVTEPDINSPDEAYAYLTKLKSIIEYLGVSDCDMEKGSLRCDANVSIRKKGAKELGVKTEVKNMNSFKGVKEALGFEIERQIGLLNKGRAIIQETRLWDAKELKTSSMRAKEEAQDYRYFPEPDLTTFVITQEKIEELRESIPELPQEKLLRFIKDYGLSEYDAGILVASRQGADYAEECFKKYPGKDKKPIANWLIGPLLREANTRNCALVDLKVSPEYLTELVNFLENGQISNLTAKSVLTEMVETKKSPAAIIQEKNLVQISDSAGLNDAVEEAIKENAKSVNDYKQGKSNALMFLVGQVMRKTKSRANPQVVQEILKGRLDHA